MAISAISLARSFIIDSGFVKSLNDSDCGLVSVEELRRFGKIFHISAGIFKSAVLVCISSEQRSVLQLVKSAHKAHELLSVDTRNLGASVGVFELFGDETHRKDKSVSVLIVLILSSHKGENVVKARLVELELRDGKVETMDGAANNLD